MQKETLTTILTQICEDLDYPNAEVSLVLTDDVEIRSLNAHWRNQDKATDVLSFPQLETSPVETESWAPTPLEIPVVLGDIVISVETARRYAQEHAIDPRSEMARLLVHGMLHLVGYDHEEDLEEAKRMREKEETLLSRLEPWLPGIALEPKIPPLDL